jgi:indolepyruvate ferredoxin oxidoreductase, beta subunit
MRKDIILSGVGGQGILTIATIIGEAATVAGLNLKQAEVHGMSQRGGDVQARTPSCSLPVVEREILLTP